MFRFHQFLGGFYKFALSLKIKPLLMEGIYRTHLYMIDEATGEMVSDVVVQQLN